MRITFGKYMGRVGEPGLIIEWIVLNDPSYVSWLLRKIKPNWKIRGDFETMRELIAVFDKKPFIKKCSNQDCKKPATESYVYGNTLQLHFRCKKCGALISRSGVFTQIGKYRQAIDYVRMLHGDKKDKIKKFIGRLALAKGLPERGGKDQLYAFFGTCDDEDNGSPYSNTSRETPRKPAKETNRGGWRTVSLAQYEQSLQHPAE